MGAKTRYDQGLDAYEKAMVTQDRVKAATAYEDAARLFALAVTETKQQGEAVVGAARKAAEAAREQAQTTDVRQYAGDELKEADGLLGSAGKERDFQKAKRLYDQAAAKYAQAVEVTPGRKRAEEAKLGAAEQDARTAKSSAQRQKDRIGADERQYAKQQVADGDQDWAGAERKLSSAATVADHESAARLYAQAESHYAEALRVTPGLKKAAQEPLAGESRTFAGIEMVWVPPGTFSMGSPSSEEDRDSDETQHRVTLTKGFWMGKYEVTQAQWRAVMGSNPSKFSGSNLPVEQVSWNDCQDFIRKLNAKGQGTFRLPTEAEWEYACRAGTTTPYFWGTKWSPDKCMAENDVGSNEDSGVEYYRSRGLPVDSTAPVGSFAANRWGLHDMHGNVYEWCEDWYGDYPSGSVTNPTGPSTGSRRVFRGGGWYSFPRRCRSANRFSDDPDLRYGSLGFRLARVADR